VQAYFKPDAALQSHGIGMQNSVRGFAMKTMLRIRAVAFGLFAASLFLGQAQAIDKSVEARLNQVMGDPKLRAAAVKAGQRAAFFCENCHGATGNSPLEHVPNLAGQNAVYLLNQIDKFGDGRRQDEFMSGLVKVIKPEDRFNMAVFYASQNVVPGTSQDVRQLEKGRSHFARACLGCHGVEARGTREIARLAGQKKGYTVHALKGYRAGQAMRADPSMTSVAKKLDDAQIQALALYLNTLR
jgi:cytochrome c553